MKKNNNFALIAIACFLLSTVSSYAQFTADVDGKLDVSTLNGFMTYTYPISNNSIDGFPIKVDLVYVNNILDIRLANYYDYPSNNGDIWSKSFQMRAHWIMGVNGFAINVLKKCNSFVNTKYDSAKIRDRIVVNSEVPTLTEGYDVCNRMQKLSSVGDYDKISLLKSDGSVLELINVYRKNNSNSINEAQLYTGKYIENNANPEGYALVSYDDKYWPLFIQQKFASDPRYSTQYNALRPRVVKYYRGDGLEYVFREVVTAYGIRPLLGTIMSGSNVADSIVPWGAIPTIFYLEEINSDQKNLLTFEREEKPLLSDTIPYAHGRSFITSFENHKFTFGDSAVIIEYLDRHIRCNYLNWDHMSTNPINYYYYQEEKNFEMDSSTIELLNNKYTYCEPVIEKIIDPVGRTTNFNYDENSPRRETYPESYKDFNILSEVIEPTKKMNISYWNYNNLDGNMPREMSDNFYNVTKEVKYYDLSHNNNNILKSINYYFYNGTGERTLNFCINNNAYNRICNVIEYDSTLSSTILNTYYCYNGYSVTPYNQIIDDTLNAYKTLSYSLLLPKAIKTLYWNYQQQTYKVDELHYIYKKYDSYQSILIDTVIELRRIINKVCDTEYHYDIIAGDIPLSMKTYSYDLISSNDFPDNASLNYNYGLHISKKREFTHNPKTRSVLFESVSEYMHLPLNTVSANGVVSQFNRLETRDLNYLRRLNVSNVPWVGDFSQISIQDRTLPPIWSIPTSEIIKDAQGNVISGKKYNYQTTYDPNSGYRRGALISDSVISRNATTTQFSSLYEYTNDSRKNLLKSVTNILGVKANSYYSYPEVPGYSTTSPAGKILFNDDGYYNKSLWREFFEYEVPACTEAIVRRENQSGSIETFPLRNFFKVTYFGQKSALVEPNGWMSVNEYDKNGRLRYSWLPFDFPHCVSDFDFIDDTIVTLYNQKTILKKTYITLPYLTHAVVRNEGCTIDTMPNVLKVGNSTTPLNVKALQRMQENGVQVSENYAASFSYVSSSNDLFHRGTGITQAYLLLHYNLSSNNECMVVNIKTSDSSFNENYLIGCNAIKTMDPSFAHATEPDEPVMKINISPLINHFHNLSSREIVDFQVSTHSASGTMEILAFSEDSRPQIVVNDNGCDRHADFTTKCDYNDTARTMTASAKIDDNHHNSEDNWAATAGHDNRFTSSVNFYGADNRKLKTFSLIGNPTSPTRTDSIIYKLSGSSLLLETKDQDGNLFKNQYDLNGNSITSIAPDNSTRNAGEITIKDSAIAAKTGLNFYGVARCVTSTDEMGNKTYEYSDMFGRVRYKYAGSDESRGIKYDYDLVGNLISVTHPDDTQTLYVYDEFHRVKYKISPDVGKLSYRYDKLGRLRFSQNDEQASQNKVSYVEYDDLGRITISGETKIDTAVLDLRQSTTTRLTDALNPDVLNVYPESNNLVTVNQTLHLTSTVTIPTFWRIDSLFAVSCLGDNIAITPLQKPPYLAHPLRYYNLETTVMSNVNSFENVKTHPENVFTVMQYDDAPRRTGAVWSRYPEQARWDSLIPCRAWNANKAPRNLLGRAVAVAYRDNGAEPFHYVTYSYDPRGRVEAQLRYTENLGFDAVYYTYNSMNQVIKVQVSDSIRQYCMWYGYDDNGRLKHVWTKLGEYGSGLASINSQKRCLDELFKPVHPDVTYQYDKRGNVKYKYFADSLFYQYYVYNSRGMLDSTKSYTNKGSIYEIFNLVLTRDVKGRITTQKSKKSGNNYSIQNYYYDNHGWLSEWTYQPSVGTRKSEEYFYDLMGNIINFTKDESYSDYIYNNTSCKNQLNEIISENNYINPSKSYEYNRIGAVTNVMVEKGGSRNFKESFAYTAGGRVKEYRKIPQMGGTHEYSDTVITRYRYGSSGVREQKREYLPGNSHDVNYNSWTYYLLGAGGEQLAVYKGVEQNLTKASCRPSAGNYVTMYAESYLAAGGTLITLPNKMRQFNITDHLGSVRCVVTVDTINNISNRKYMNYRPFGDTVNCDGDVERLSYLTEERDVENSYTQLGARTYDPTIGRFLSCDPLFEAFPAWNPYHYCFNNPLGYKDPSGLKPEKEKSEKGNKVQTWYFPNEDPYGFMVEHALLSAEFVQEMESGSVAFEAMWDAFDKRMLGGGESTVEQMGSHDGNRLGLHIRFENGVISFNSDNCQDDGTLNGVINEVPEFNCPDCPWTTLPTEENNDNNESEITPEGGSWLDDIINAIDNITSSAINDAANAIDNMTNAAYNLVPNTVSVTIPNISLITVIGVDVSTSVNWIVKGDNASWVPSITGTYGMGIGWDLSISAGVSLGYYNGDANKVNSSTFETNLPNVSFFGSLLYGNASLSWDNNGNRFLQIGANANISLFSRWSIGLNNTQTIIK